MWSLNGISNDLAKKEMCLHFADNPKYKKQEKQTV